MYIDKDLLAKDQVNTLDHHPQFPDLASGNLYVFLLLRSALKWRRFRVATDIIKNAT